MDRELPSYRQNLNIPQFFESLSTEHHTLLFMDYQADLLEGGVNAVTYRKIVEKYLLRAKKNVFGVVIIEKN